MSPAPNEAEPSAQDIKAVVEPRLLVVEGKEELVFFSALLEGLSLQKIQVLPIGGKEKIHPNLKALVATPGFSGVTSLGIVRDADDDPGASFQSVCSALKAAGLPIPRKPLETVGPKPRVSVMILPEASITGAIEDICLKAVLDDPVLPCVDQYFQCLQDTKKQNTASSFPKNESKARIHVFLASREKPNLRLGEAAQKGIWPWQHKAFDQIKGFLRVIGE